EILQGGKDPRDRRLLRKRCREHLPCLATLRIIQRSIDRCGVSGERIQPYRIHPFACQFEAAPYRPGTVTIVRLCCFRAPARSRARCREALARRLTLRILQTVTSQYPKYHVPLAILPREHEALQSRHQTILALFPLAKQQPEAFWPQNLRNSHDM